MDNTCHVENNSNVWYEHASNAMNVDISSDSLKGKGKNSCLHDAFAMTVMVETIE